MVEKFGELSSEHHQLKNRTRLLEAEIEWAINYIERCWDGNADARDALLRRLCALRRSSEP